MSEVILNTPRGPLDARYQGGERDNCVALVLPPFPSEGGGVNHPATFALFYAAEDCGFPVLRFNPRGVGRSFGEFTEAGFAKDAEAALRFLQAQNPSASSACLMAEGRSCGEAFRMAGRRPEIMKIVLVSPVFGPDSVLPLPPLPAGEEVLCIRGGGEGPAALEDARRTLAARTGKGVRVEEVFFETAAKDLSSHLRELSARVIEFLRSGHV